MDSEPEPAAVAPPSPPAGPSPRVRPHAWGFGAFLLVVGCYLAVGLMLLVLSSREGGATVADVLVAIVLPSAAAAALAIAVTRWRGNGPRADLKLFWSWRGAGIGLLFGLGGLTVTLPLSFLYVSIVGTDANAAAAAAFGELQTTWPWAVLVFCCAVFVAPVCEEIVYRGLLWGAVDWRWGRWVALLVTTVVFAFAHLELTRTPLLLIVAIPLGLARLYSGTLIAGMVAHMVTNLLPGVVIMLSLVGRMPTA